MSDAANVWPAVLAISGAHNSGKTTLIERLLPLLHKEGLAVAVIKHDGHDFVPDVPGTDSYRLREAGAAGVAVYSGKRYLLYEERQVDEKELLDALTASGRYDLVLLEGFKYSAWPKLEVVRGVQGPVSAAPLCIAGDYPGAELSLDDPEGIIAWIIKKLPDLRAAAERMYYETHKDD